jgi:hypothetical protein
MIFGRALAAIVDNKIATNMPISSPIAIPFHWRGWLVGCLAARDPARWQADLGR